jgi:hypothetical protein
MQISLPPFYLASLIKPHTPTFYSTITPTATSNNARTLPPILLAPDVVILLGTALGLTVTAGTFGTLPVPCAPATLVLLFLFWDGAAEAGAEATGLAGALEGDCAGAFDTGCTGAFDTG